MKKLIFSCLLSLLVFSASNAQDGTERTGYEGDYFSLEGAIELFKNSYSISDFERKLNREDSWVNNLDLNFDGRIDYVRVEHINEGDFHAIILQVPISRREVQDVAVIEIERVGTRRAMLQIVGDEDLYGEEVIVEPIADNRYSDRNGYVNVYYWDAVQHIFGRDYRTYASPYYWDYYPTWWSPWRPCTWNIFRPRIVIYHRHYHVVHVHRVVGVHHFYRPHRHYSSHVVHHTNQVRVHHGKAPIHRPAVKHNDRSGDYHKGGSRMANKTNATPSRDKTPHRTISSRPKAAPQKVNPAPGTTSKAPRTTTSKKGKQSVGHDNKPYDPKVKKERWTGYRSEKNKAAKKQDAAPTRDKSTYNNSFSRPQAAPQKEVTRSSRSGQITGPEKRKKDKQSISSNTKRSAPKANKERRSSTKSSSAAKSKSNRGSQANAGQSRKSSASSKKSRSSSGKKTTKSTTTKKSKSSGKRGH